MRKEVATKLERLSERGSVGAYCPLRALYLLDPTSHIRFFDDAPTMTGKYLPPFSAPIEDRAAFLESPTASLVIFSRTFGGELREQLYKALAERCLSCDIYTIDDLTGEIV